MDGYRYHVTLCIDQPHPSQSVGTSFGVCTVLALSVIVCTFHYFLDKVLFHHDFHHGSCD